MIDEAGIVDLTAKEASWEEVLEYIISEEGMDPWEIDVVKLADAFREYVAEMKRLDFKVPARLIVIASVLLHMKAEILMWEEEEEEDEEEDEGPPIDVDRVPDLEVPTKRMPTRRVSLDELVHALEKAFDTKERRERKVRRARERVEEVVETGEDLDISEKIDELYERISAVVERMESGTLPFSEIVPRWERKEVVESLLGVLHMTDDEEVTLEQERPFDEIYVKVDSQSVRGTGGA